MHHGFAAPSVPAARTALATIVVVAAGLGSGCGAFLTRADAPSAAVPGVEAARYAWRAERHDPAVRPAANADDEARDPLFARRVRRAALLAQDDELKKAPAKTGLAPAPVPAPTPAPVPMPKAQAPLMPPVEAPKAAAKPADDLKGTGTSAKTTPMPPPVSAVPLERAKPLDVKPPENSAGPAPAAPMPMDLVPRTDLTAPIPAGAPPIVEHGPIFEHAPIAMPAPQPFSAAEGGHVGVACPTAMATVQCGLGQPIVCTKGVSADQPGLADNFSARFGGVGSFPKGGPDQGGGLAILESSKQMGGRPWFGYAGIAGEYLNNNRWPLGFSFGFSKLATLQGCCVANPWIVALNYDGYYDSQFQGRDQSAYLDQARGLLGYALKPGLDVGVWGTRHLSDAAFQTTATTRLTAATRVTTTRIVDRLADRAAAYVSADLNNKGAQVIASAGWQESPGHTFAEIDTFLPVARNVNLWTATGYSSNGTFDAAAGVELLYGQATLQARGRCADSCGSACGDPCGERYRGGWANGTTRSALRVQTPSRLRRSLADPEVFTSIVDTPDPVVRTAAPPPVVVPPPVVPINTRTNPPVVNNPPAPTNICPPRLAGHTTKPRNPLLPAATWTEPATAAAPQSAAQQTLSEWLRTNGK